MIKGLRTISIVTPCYNEEQGVEDCYRSVRRVFEQRLTGYDYEHVFCDNASTDRTLTILKTIAARDKRVKLIANAMNYGASRSALHGVLNATGDSVVTLLPADLQDPPELIEEFVRKWEDGYEVVCGVRTRREEFAPMRCARYLYYRLIRLLADRPLGIGVGDYQLIDRKIVELLRQYDHHYPFIRGMIAACGGRTAEVEYTWKTRRIGSSKHRLGHLIDYGLNGLVSVTKAPLRWCMMLGLIATGSSVLYGVVGLAWGLFATRPIFSGTGAILAGSAFLSGLQLFFTGFLAEYVVAIHSQLRRPLMVVERERINWIHDPLRSGPAEESLISADLSGSAGLATGSAPVAVGLFPVGRCLPPIASSDRLGIPSDGSV